MTCQLSDGTKHYYILSKQDLCIYNGGGYEPDEYGKAYVEVAARNKREARLLAIKHRDMREYVCERRGDNKVPFGGLDVEEMCCKHGTCFGCQEECPGCELEYHRQEAQETLLAEAV